MSTADVVIVGGGPAGSSCAWKLRRSGLDVVVLDRALFPRDKVCAGWITPGVFEALRVDSADYRRGRVLQPITGFRTSCPGEKQVETRYDEPVSYGIRRLEFDAYLLARCGARLECGVAATRFERAGGGWIVNDTIAARLLVGAGGHFCPVARMLNPDLREDTVVAAEQIEVLLDSREQASCPVRPDTPELYLSPDLRGYGWCFRKASYLNVGFGRQDSRELPRHVRGFAAFLRQSGRVPADLPPRWHGHAYLLYGTHSRRVIHDGVLLIGDAAGLAYAQSGEGIRPAIESGLLAADAVLVAGGRYRRGDLEPYERSLTGRFGTRSVAASFRRRVPPPLMASVARRLLRSHWFTRRVVLDRWFLHTQQASLGA